MKDTRLKFTVSRALARRLQARFCGTGRDGDASALIFLKPAFVGDEVQHDRTGVERSVSGSLTLALCDPLVYHSSHAQLQRLTRSA